MNEITSSEKSNLMGTLSMVFGILATVFSFTLFSKVFVILLGIAAIVLGVIELDRVRRGLTDRSAKNMAIAGIVLGGVSIVLFTVITIAWKAFAFHGFAKGITGEWNLPAFGKFRHFR